jgi:penicillin amidase
VNEDNFNWDFLNSISQKINIPSVDGSNAWVISGEHTTSKKPILCSDPHLVPAVPCFWHLCHLKSKDNAIDVIGAGSPGLPSILIGHNGKVAHGITVSYASTSDLFFEQIRKTGNIKKS